MRIHSLTFCDKNTQWSIKEVSFQQLTLLVGASGVGKTKILKSILTLIEITQGKPVDGITWRIEFTTTDENKYVWEGAYEAIGHEVIILGEGDPKIKDPEIISEKLYLNNQLIIERDTKEIKFQGIPTIKLSPTESIISLLKEEKLIQPIFQDFFRILDSDQTNTRITKDKYIPRFFGDVGTLPKKLIELHPDLETIRASGKSAKTKLFMAMHSAKAIFQQIKRRFIEIFPFVEDVTFARLEMNDLYIIELRIKEKNVTHWIEEKHISSGMYRTLLQLSELYLCAEGTVILIDEFENSLGVNCLDELTNDVMASRKTLQFILTSHHPYIINQIPHENWKLVTRKGCEVRVQPIDELVDFSKSKHKAFNQLIQLDEYQTGINEDE